MRKFLLSFGLLIGLTACQNSKTEIGLPPENDPRVPDIEISLENPPDSIIYFTSHYPGATPENSFFTAKGLGGLGGRMAGDANTLVPFDGFKVTVTEGIPQKNIHVTLAGSGDSICNELFVFDAESSKIKMNADAAIESLTECVLNVSVSATSENARSANVERSFPFVFNLTMVEYAQKKDPLVKALMKQNNFSTIENLIAWLELGYNSSSIKVNPDPQFADQIRNANALTGLIYLEIFDVSETAFDSTRALSYLPQLRELNLSKTKITSSELLALAQKTNVSNLTIESLENLIDVSFLEANFKNLNTLDVSNNARLLMHLSADDVTRLGGLNQLSVLKIANTGLVNFGQFSRLANFDNTLTFLDVSGNDFWTLDNSDSSFLKGLKNLETFDVSNSIMSTIILNDYFAFIERSDNSKLKTFIYRGSYVSSEPADSGRNLLCSDESAIFTKNISNLILPSSLEAIDFHGQGCLNEDQTAQGLVDTNIFERVTNLDKLDISSTPVKDFNGLKNLENLHDVIVADADGPIAMSRSGCMQAKENLLSYVENINCSMLPDAGKLSRLFNANTNMQSFVVPDNVWNITVTGCSGANGGAGGGASGSLGTMILQVDQGSTMHVYASVHAEDGGDSGIVNGQSGSFTPGASTPIRTTGVTVESGSWPLQSEYQFSYPAYPLQKGAQGEVGSPSEVFSQDGSSLLTFSPASVSAFDQIEKCIGGSNGIGGAPMSARNILLMRTTGAPRSVVQGFISGSGAQNSFAPWSSPIESHTLSVLPGQTLNVAVGFGGQGGRGGTSQYITTSRDGVLLDGHELTNQYGGDGKENKDYLGQNGANGTAGSNGFVKIEWDAG